MNIILCGSNGKCGSAVKKVLTDNNYQIVAEVNENSHPLCDVLKTNSNIDYVIDFTTKEVSYDNILLCIKYKIPFICGTTNFTEEEINTIKEKCNKAKIKGAICYNFSMPINFLIKNFNELSSFFKTISLEETHHKSKLDVPSGTAKILKQKSDKPLNITSYKSDDFLIDYKITFTNKYDKMVMHYQVYSKMVYAQGLLTYLKLRDESLINNLLSD